MSALHGKTSKSAALVSTRAVAHRPCEFSGRKANVKLMHDALIDDDGAVSICTNRHEMLDTGHTRGVTALCEHVHDHLCEAAAVETGV